jgi:hypothetical protein
VAAVRSSHGGKIAKAMHASGAKHVCTAVQRATEFTQTSLYKNMQRLPMGTTVAVPVLAMLYTFTSA